MYWKVKKPGTYSLKSGFPTFYDGTASDPRKLYAIPSFEYPDMVKVIYMLDISQHQTCQPLIVKNLEVDSKKPGDFLDIN